MRGRGSSGFRWRAVVGVTVAGVVLVGCGSGDAAATGGSASSTVSSTTGAGTSGDAPAAGVVTVSDPWVKAIDGSSAMGMTAAFGILHNSSDRDLTVVSATNTATDRTELHEMATVDGAMVMRAVAAGITIPAGGSTTLAPGGLHVMIMNARAAITPGEEVGVTLTMSDGSTVTFQAPAKEFAGANEQYDGGTTAPMTGGMDMGGMTAPPTGATDMGGMTAPPTGAMDMGGMTPTSGS